MRVSISRGFAWRVTSGFVTVSLAALWLYGCSSSGVARPDSTAATGASDSLGKATFSAVIDGAPVSGGAIDSMQQGNAAYSIPDDKGGENLLFWLFDTRVPDDRDFMHSLRISLPKRTGSTTNAYIGVIIVLDKNHEARYNSAAVTVNIISLSATRVSGTFSGTFRLSPDTPNVPKKQITITDGKFDIPFATSKIIPS